MEKTHFGQHEDDCFACKIQTIQISPQATPNRRQKLGPPPRTPDPAWERGIPTDSRGMPFLRKDGITPMGQKEYAENRSRIDEHRRRLANSTEPVLPSTTGSKK